jgi:hypothetical protein
VTCGVRTECGMSTHLLSKTVVQTTAFYLPLISQLQCSYIHVKVYVFMNNRRFYFDLWPPSSPDFNFQKCSSQILEAIQSQTQVYSENVTMVNSLYTTTTGLNSAKGMTCTLLLPGAIVMPWVGAKFYCD